jgi:hypothetical protein
VAIIAAHQPLTARQIMEEMGLDLNQPHRSVRQTISDLGAMGLLHLETDTTARHSIRPPHLLSIAPERLPELETYFTELAEHALTTASQLGQLREASDPPV